MNLSITSAITTSNGQSVTGVVGYLRAHTDNLMTNGTVQCDIDFYISDAARTAKMDRIYPAVLNTDNSLKARIASCIITLTSGQATGANLPLVIYQAVAAYLSTTYGWTCTAIS